MEKFKFLEKKRMAFLPKTSGVYAFWQKRQILYIGKAVNIRERVKSHFQQRTFKENFFISEIEKIGYIKTNSEIEALLLEAALIKKYQPKFNLLWRDDKNYFFVGITKEDFPRVSIVHQLKIENCKLKIDYIGPFVDGKALKQTLNSLRKAFPYRSCRVLGKQPCLWYHLGRCPAPCLLKMPKAKGKLPPTIIQKKEFGRIKKECQRNAQNLIKILTKGKTPVVKELKKEMKLAAKNQDFEQAAKIRDQILALEKIISHARIFDTLQTNSKLKSSLLFCSNWKSIEKKLRQILGRKLKKKIFRIEAYDVSNIQGSQATGSMVTFVQGKPSKNFYRKFRIKTTSKPNDIAMLKEVLSRRFKHPEWAWPDLILIDGGRAQLNAARTIIAKQKLSIKVLALAKKKNNLYLENQKTPLALESLPNPVKFLLLHMRDEAHRFVLGYHKKLRKNAFFN